MFSTYHALLRTMGGPTTHSTWSQLLVFSLLCTFISGKSSPDFPAEYLSRWLSIWSRWWNLVCACPVLWDVEVTVRREVFWEEIIILQTLKMRLLSWPRQASCFCWWQPFATWPHNIIATRKMTFPLLFWRDELHFLAFSLCCSTLWCPSPCFYPRRRWRRCLWIYR